MSSIFRIFILGIFVVLLSGCSGLLGSVTKGLRGSSASSSAISSDRGLIGYEQARRRAAVGQLNPNRRPRTIVDAPSYTFQDEIPFFRPGVGEKVGSDFGWRKLWGKAEFHCGVDVTAPAGARVLAVTGGKVTFLRSAGPHGGVVIYHKGRQYTYWHVVPARSLKSGYRVRPGQTIGHLADWGNNTHIHYGIYLTGSNNHPDARQDSNCVDPMQLAHRGLY